MIPHHASNALDGLRHPERLQNVVSQQGVALHQFVLFWGQSRGLVENRIRHANLAKVVQEAANANLLDLRIGQAHLACGPSSEP